MSGQASTGLHARAGGLPTRRTAATSIGSIKRVLAGREDVSTGSAPPVLQKRPPIRIAARQSTHQVSHTPILANPDATPLRSIGFWRRLRDAKSHIYFAYDGKIFFADDHESGESGAQSNILTPAATDADAPTTAEFKAALGAAITQLLTLKDDHGEPMNPDATGLVAVVPPSMYITALEALSATVISQTTNVLAGAAKVVAFPRLTDASKWFLLKTNVPVRPFIFQDRESIEFKALEGESEAGFMREVYTYGVRARYAITFAAWQHALQLDFTTE